MSDMPYQPNCFDCNDACATCAQEIERLTAEGRKLRCPDNPGGRHRWNGDGQCLDCTNYATDLIDSVSGRTTPPKQAKGWYCEDCGAHSSEECECREFGVLP